MDSKVPSIKIAPNIDWRKVSKDLSALKSLKEFAKKYNWRIVVARGYSLDLFLNMTTRTHNDIDLMIFGQEKHEEAIKILSTFLSQIFRDAEMIAKHDSTVTEIGVSGPGYGANIYFIETVEDPFVNNYKVRNTNGEIVENNQTQFPKPGKGKIGDLEVEIQDQNAHLADILTKYTEANSPVEFAQDIENLRHITDSTKVELILKSK